MASPKRLEEQVMSSTVEAGSFVAGHAGRAVGDRSLPLRLGSALLWTILIVVVAVLIIAPIAYVLVTAFHGDLRFGVSKDFTLKTLAEVYLGADYLNALKDALVLSALVTFFSVVVGVTLALIVARIAIPAKSLVNVLVLMPMFLSPFNGLIAWFSLASEKTGFLNIGIASLFHWLDLPVPAAFNILSYWGAVWIMFLSFAPYIYLFTVTNLQRMDSSLEEAARTCGAGALRTLLKVTLPVCLPSILASALLVFILAAETYTIPGIIGTSAGFNVLPWQIYIDAMQPPIRQAHASAAASMLLLTTILGILVQRQVTRKSERFATVLGKGMRSTPLNIGRWKGAAIAFVWLYIVVSTVLPLSVLMLSSLLQYTSQTLSPSLFTLRHYISFFSGADTRLALVNTLLLAGGASIACMLLGVVIGYAEVRSRRFVPRLLALICTLPVAVPGIVYGLGLQQVYLRTPIYGTITVLLLAYIARNLPYGIMVSRSAIMQIHPDLEQCARSCGAGQWRVLTRITMPLVASSLAAIVFFVMLLVIKDLSATLVLFSQRSQTLSVLTWAFVEAGEYQFAAAVAVVQTVMIIALVLAVRFFFNIRLETIGGRT
jgi:iron(III) transport system permease protein